MTLEKWFVPQSMSGTEQGIFEISPGASESDSFSTNLSHFYEPFTAALVVRLSALSNIQFFHQSFFRVLSSAEIAESIQLMADLSLVTFCYLSDPDLWCSYLHDTGNSHLMYCAGFTALCTIGCESPQHESDSEQLSYIFTCSLKNSSGVRAQLYHSVKLVPFLKNLICIKMSLCELCSPLALLG